MANIGIKPTVNIVTDYSEAIKQASNKPGEVVHFRGQLPSGLEAEQQITRVPNGKNPFEPGQLGAVEGDKLVSSSTERGTFVIGILSRTKGPA